MNLITGAKGGISVVSPTCHYRWQRSTQRDGFVIRYAFIKETYYDYMADCSITARVSRLGVVGSVFVCVCGGGKTGKQ